MPYTIEILNGLDISQRYVFGGIVELETAKRVVSYHLEHAAHTFGCPQSHLVCRIAHTETTWCRTRSIIKDRVRWLKA